MISIGQGLEHSTDMEMVDLSTYVPHLSPVTQQYFIRYSGRIMAIYSGLTTVERPFILAPYPNLTPEHCSRVLSSISKYFPFFFMPVPGTTSAKLSP